MQTHIRDKRSLHLSSRSRGDSTGSSHALLGELALVQANSHIRGSLGDLLSGLSKVDLNVARRAAVRVDTTVSTVSAAVSLRGLLHSNVADNKSLSVKTLSLSVRLGVLKKAKKELDRLHRPATLSSLELLHLLGAANTTVEAAERNGLLVLNNVVEVSVSLLELHTIDGGGSLARVLEVNTQVSAARLGRLLRQLGIVKRVAGLLHVRHLLTLAERR